MVQKCSIKNFVPKKRNSWLSNLIQIQIINGNKINHLLEDKKVFEFLLKYN